MRTPLIVIGAAVVVSVAACGHASREPQAGPVAPARAVQVQVGQSSLGPILTDQSGRTLYAFVNDKAGASVCTGECIATWPALVSKRPVSAGTGIDRSLLSQATRAEGTVQATYNNWPLYYYVGDVGPGDVDGQGVDAAWYVVGADGKLVKTSTPS